jgi:hypothetical protein
VAVRAGNETTFSNGERGLERHWPPAREYAAFVNDRSKSADLHTTAAIEGGEARLFRYAGTNDYTAYWIRRGAMIEARGLAADVDEFRRTLASLREVEAEMWLSAMPESVVEPA